MADETIRGYRVVGDRPRDRSLSYTYLQQDSRSAKLLSELRTEAVNKGANCLGKPEQWTSDELPSDKDAQLMCASCPVFDLCKQYSEAAHPAWGVWATGVKGRKLKEAMEE
ncbi:WhiB family transcription factor [Microbacterium phage LeeroyJenkins]|nr:WhiB family transcription factor [Microbacterium phage LeeroyJenkins]